MGDLHHLGVFEVVLPEFEASLEIVRQALLHLNMAASQIQRFTDDVRRELYAPVYEEHADYHLVARLQSATRLLELTWLTITTDSPIVGKTIRELDIRTQTGVSIVSVMHDGRLLPNPDGDYCFAADDIAAVMGDNDQLATFQEMVHPAWYEDLTHESAAALP
jgi:CPA2 family monovalent cation:H+ antiporter-2